MYQRVTFSDFRQAFHNHDRGNQFSHVGYMVDISARTLKITR